MISANISQTVKATLSLKQAQITNYGKRGEINPRGFKVKYYSYFPAKSSRYISIKSIVIDWVPTVSHLVTGTELSITIKDKRSALLNKTNGCLTSFKRRAEDIWTASIDTCLYFPISELRTGIPLMFDIGISNQDVKSDVEIGVFTFRISFMTENHAGKSEIGSIIFDGIEQSQAVPSLKSECTFCKFDKNQVIECKANLLISSYLNGDMNLRDLQHKLRELVTPKDVFLLSGS
ncbi:TPA_asm: P3 [Celery gammacytorhabdovirus 1]|nr:TPA_asm: P3 [Celery gammacytorhabdovirus 1]